MYIDLDIVIYFLITIFMSLKKFFFKIKNYNVIFQNCSAVNEFTRKLLKYFTKLHFFTKNKKLFHKNKKKKLFSQR